ncbi:MAG: hypothetical protein WDN23_00025 [Edaphobacter sp.]
MGCGSGLRVACQASKPPVEVGDVAKASAARDAGGDDAAIATFAVDHEEL